jgi:hypothetical protein
VDLRENRTSLEQRGVAVVSTSGILVALLFGFSTIARRSADIHIAQSARLWFYLALRAFALATATALLVAFPWRVEATRTAALEGVLRDRWNDPESPARRRVAVTRLKLYATYRRANRRKGLLLALAILSEVAAVMLLGSAIGLVIAHSK